MKAFVTEKTNSQTATRYAVMSLLASCSTAAMLLGSISRHISEGKLSVLIIIFNILSIALQPIIACYADSVKNKHTGVRLSVLILALGFLIPAKISVTAKVILMGIGSAGFNAFSASSILQRAKRPASDIGYFLAGSVLGVALGRYQQFYGYLAVALLMIIACPADKGEKMVLSEEKKACPAKMKLFTPIFGILLILSAFGASVISSSVPLDGFYGKKMMVVTAAAIAFGYALGGIISERLTAISNAATLVAGTVILFTFQDSQKLFLIALALIATALPMLTAQLSRLMPRYSGFAYSLLSVSVYLGYVFKKLREKPQQISGTVLIIIAVLILAVGISSGIFLKLKNRAEDKK